MSTCPRCGEPAARDQEYCLECGVRLTSAGVRVPARGPNWIVRALLAGVVALAGTAAAVAATDRGGGRVALTTAIGGFTTASGAATLPAPSEGGPSSATDWPAGTDGWTVLLGTYPQTAGRQAAEASAQRARARGLQQVGILDSSRYASLHPGYWVVFAGVYASEAEATSALESARKVSRVATVSHVVA